MIKKILEKIRDKRQEISNAESSDRIQDMIETRKKSSNERELERFMEIERQKAIKERLDSFRRRESQNMLVGENVISQRNIFKGHKNILSGKNIFKNNPSENILRQKNIFANNPNIFTNQKSMFGV